MIVLLIIGSATAAAVIVIAAAVILGRNAVRFSRNAARFQQRVDPYVQGIQRAIPVIQARSLTVSEKAEYLQFRVNLLNITLAKLQVLAAAWQKAMEPVNRIRSYLGL